MPETLVDRSSKARNSAGPLDTYQCVLTYGGRESVWVRLVGELDLATAPQLELTLRRAQRRARLTVLDLRELAFVDGAGVEALLRADARARRSAGRLVIVNVSPRVRRLSHLTSFARLLAIADDPSHVDATQRS